VTSAVLWCVMSQSGGNLPNCWRSVFIFVSAMNVNVVVILRPVENAHLKMKGSHAAILFYIAIRNF
jgi:hypothetical protein